jgi:AcrR family transcriptional regulator
MARTLNPTTHAVRREAFVDVAERLIQVKGYEQASVQDVLDELDASRGAFYHYFDSKAELLEAVIERMVNAVIAELEPLANDPDIAALDKLQGIFSTLARWKGERSELMLAILDVWLADHNAIVREKFRKELVVRMTPLLTTIIAQGRAEGAFLVDDPGPTARVLVALFQGANETATDLFFARRSGAITFDEVERALAAYWTAFERLLGLPAGSMTTLDPAILHEWYDDNGFAEVRP